MRRGHPVRWEDQSLFELRSSASRPHWFSGDREQGERNRHRGACRQGRPRVFRFSRPYSPRWMDSDPRHDLGGPRNGPRALCAARGIRDITPVDTGLLILAGPVGNVELSRSADNPIVHARMRPKKAPMGSAVLADYALDEEWGRRRLRRFQPYYTGARIP